jgi:catechol 2,3-dioxygenase-like lactoylglutathione lyase family enzyme
VQPSKRYTRAEHFQENAMANASLTFDHVHLVARDPSSTAEWYVDKLGGKIVRSVEVKGAPQVYVALGGFIVIVRGERPNESIQDKDGLEWGVDHFGVRVQGEFDAFCSDLRKKGVTFSLEPVDFNPTTRIAFINAPDGVSIELLNRKEQLA